MSNVSLELLKQSQKNKGKDNELHYANEAAKTGGALEKMKYDISSGVPNSSDDIASGFLEARKEMGGGVQRGWRALLSGVLTGAAIGTKAKGNEERREKAEKSAAFIQSLEGHLHAVTKKREQVEKKMEFQKFIQPQLRAYAENIGKMSDADARKSGEEFTDKYNKFWGANKRLGVFDKQQGIAILTENGKPDQRVDLFEMFPDVGSERTIAELTKRAYAQEGLANQHKQDRNDILRDDLNRKTQGMSDKQIKQFNDTFNASIRSEETIDLMLDLVKKNPGVFGSMKSYMLNTTDDAKFNDYLLGKMDKKDKETLEQFNKFRNVLATDLAKGFTRQNMFLEKQINNSISNATMTAESMNKLLKQMKKAEGFKRQQESTKVEHNPYISEAAHDLAESGENYLKSSTEYPLMTPEEQAAAGKNIMPPRKDEVEQGRTANSVQVKDPKTNQSMWLSPEKAEIAKSRGGIVVG